MFSAAQKVEKAVEKCQGDIKSGMEIIVRALEEPVCYIIENAGIESSMIIDTIKKVKKKNYGYDVSNDKFCDMVDIGIVDLEKVIRVALLNAMSMAQMLLVTDAIIAEVNTEDTMCNRPS